MATRTRVQMAARSVPVPWVVLIAVSLAWFTRQPGLSPATTIYVDDAIFLTEADASPWTSLWTSYNGYQHALPRVIVGIAAAISMEWASLTIAVLTLVVLFACLACIYLALRSQPGLVGRYAVLIAAVPALSPLASAETVANAANLQWYLLAAGIVITALGNAALWRGWPVAVLLLATGMSTPLGIVLLPGALFAMWRARRAGAPALVALLPTLGLVAGLAFQVIRYTGEPAVATSLSAPLGSMTTVNAIALLSGPMPLLGSDATYHLATYAGVPAVLLFLLSWAVIAIAGRHVAQGRRPIGTVMVARAVLLLAPGALIAATAPIIRPALRTLAEGNPGGSRYAVPLGVSMWIIVGLALALALATASWQRMALGTSVAVVAAAVVLSMGWANNVGRGQGPIWRSAYQKACAQVAPGDIVVVPTTPESWSARVRC